MSRHGWGTGLALVVLVGLAGCATSSLTTRIEVTPPSGDGAEINGSADGVAVRAQAMLQGLGLQVETQHDHDEVRLVCSTASGKHFCLHLSETQELQDSSNSTNPNPSPRTVTHIKMEWEKDADVPTEIRVKAGLGSLNAVGGIDLAAGRNQ
jgi:hypothetical protein